MKKTNKYEEALYIIGECYVCSESKCLMESDLYGKEWDTLKKCVNRETPMKPEYIYVMDDASCRRLKFRCAKCGNVIYFGENYCSYCGQKIDWSDKND